MTSLLYALHTIAAQRGDGLRTEFFKRCAGQNDDLLQMLKRVEAGEQVLIVPDADMLPIGTLPFPTNVK